MSLRCLPADASDECTLLLNCAVLSVQAAGAATGAGASARAAAAGPLVPLPLLLEPWECAKPN